MRGKLLLGEKKSLFETRVPFRGEKSCFLGIKVTFLRGKLFLREEKPLWGHKSHFWGEKSCFLGTKVPFGGRKVAFRGQKSLLGEKCHLMGKSLSGDKSQFAGGKKPLLESSYCLGRTCFLWGEVALWRRSLGRRLTWGRGILQGSDLFWVISHILAGGEVAFWGRETTFWGRKVARGGGRQLFQKLLF